MKAKNVVASLFLFALGSILGVQLYREYRMQKIEAEAARSAIPDSLTVRIDSTNLPIVFIETYGKTIGRDKPANTYVKIIANGDGRPNYCDTLSHPGQKINFEGYMDIRYRGASSFFAASKKSYALRATDPNREGKKKKSKLLGMRKGKKWALKASAIDKSMIRDALTFELARTYMEFVPQVRFCEVVLDGTYQGVYCLSEQITPDRLKLEKPGTNKADASGGYLLQADYHHIENSAQPKEKSYPSKYWNIGYLQEYPDNAKTTRQQTDYLRNRIAEIEKAVKERNLSRLARLVDINSMIDYQLAAELSHNGDGYLFSTYLYKHRDDSDGRFKFSLWDYDLAYGNYSKPEVSRTDSWMYDRQGYWWKEMMQNAAYADAVKARWRQYRTGAYSDAHIAQVIDSLANILTVGGAIRRNTAAWNVWNRAWHREVKPQKYISSSYEEELAYLREWIRRRLQWMDEQLLGT